jgi:hypothetical protein
MIQFLKQGKTMFPSPSTPLSSVPSNFPFNATPSSLADARSGTGELKTDLFKAAFPRMQAFAKLVLEGESEIIKTIQTGVALDLFALLLMHLSKEAKHFITCITLLKSPPPEEDEQLSVWEKHDRSVFAHVFTQLTSGDFPKLSQFHFTPYPLWPTEWIRLFDAQIRGKIQLTTLDLSTHARAQGETVVIQFLSHIKAGHGEKLETLVLSGWKITQYKQLIEMLGQHKLPALKHLIWQDFTRDHESFPPEDRFSEFASDNPLSRALVHLGFTLRSDPTHPTTKLFERN